MDYTNSSLDEGDNESTSIHRRKLYLSLEARHSKAVETARKIRSKLSTSIFIPKKPLKTQQSAGGPLSASPKRSPHQDAGRTAKSNQNCDLKTKGLNTKSDLKRKPEEIIEPDTKGTQYPVEINAEYKGLPKRKKVIRTKLWTPKCTKTPHRKKSIEDELKSMGLEVADDTNYCENVLKNADIAVGCDDVVKMLSLDEAIACERGKDKENLSICAKPVDATIKRKTKALKHTPTKKSTKERKCHNSETSAETGECEQSEQEQIRDKYQSYNDSVHGVREFCNVLQAFRGDMAIHRYLLELHDSVNEFSAFLYKTYRNLELMEALPGRYNQNPTMPQSASKFVVRIDVPHLMEQVLTFDTTEILKHSMENYTKDQLAKQEFAKKLENIINSSLRAKPSHSEPIKKTPFPHPAFTNQTVRNEQSALAQLEQPLETTTNCSSHKYQNKMSHHRRTQEEPTESVVNPVTANVTTTAKLKPMCRNYQPSTEVRNNPPAAETLKPFPESPVHPAFRNCNRTDTHHDPLKQQDSSRALACTTNSNHKNVSPPRVPHTSQLVFASNPQIGSTCVENYSMQSESFLRPSNKQPSPFSITYPVAPQMTSVDSDFSAVHHSHVSNPLLTPPHSADAHQALPFYRPPPSYAYPYYNPNAVIPITPPSEDFRYDNSLHPFTHQPTATLIPPAVGFYSSDRWPNIYKEVEVQPYMPHLRNALTEPSPYAPTYREF